MHFDTATTPNTDVDIATQAISTDPSFCAGGLISPTIWAWSVRGQTSLLWVPQLIRGWLSGMAQVSKA